MLSEMQDRQISLALDKSIVANLLREMLGSAPLNQGQFYTAKKWAGLLSLYIAENDKEAKGKLTPSYLGHVLSVNEELYREAFHMQKQQDDHYGHKYAFWLPGGEAAAAPRGSRGKEFPDANAPEDFEDVVIAPLPVAS